MKYSTIFILTLCFSVYSSYAQEQAQVFVRTSVQKDVILLRWALNTPLSWKQTNHSGFRLERYTVIRGGKMLDSPEKIILGDGRIKAQPLENWMPFLETNDYAGIIAQALYGKDFELIGRNTQGLAKVIHLAQELEQRFTFSLYAADQDFEMACFAGWGWKDSTVKKDERYLYRVIPATQKDSVAIPFGSAYTSLEEYRKLPCPIGFNAIWNDRSVLLNWEYGRLVKQYNSYFIEKSTDGKIFHRLPGPPVSNLNNKDNSLSESIVYIDSLSDNSQTYYYRVKGVSSFGEVGPPSDTVFGKGVAKLEYVPVIRKSIINQEGKLEIEWAFAIEENDLIKGFELRNSNKADGKYKVVMKEMAPSSRALTYDRLESSSYFVIAAISHGGEEKVSYPVLVQPLDTIAPAKPRGLKGHIDSLGVVTLSWEKNSEMDFLGYKIYRANVKKEEPYPLMDVAWQDTSYFDTVEIKNLNSEVYYYLIALDKRYNHSEMSECLELVKPDVIPPLSPLISDYKVSSRGLEIRWIPSPDEDVAEHLLYRQSKVHDTIPVLIASLSGNHVDRYVDTVFEVGERYTYSIFAIDKSDLKSSPTPSLTVIAPKQKSNKQLIAEFDAVVDKANLLVKLVWSNNLKGVRSYEVYRRENDIPMTHWKTLPGWQIEIMDNNIVVGVKYEYMIRAIFEKGGNSQVKTIMIEL